MDMTYKLYDMCLQLKMQDFGVFGMSFTQPIVENLNMGVELFGIIDNDKVKLKVTGQHKGTESSETLVSLQTGLGADQLTLAYSQKINPHLTFLSSADYSYSAERQSRIKEWVSVYKAGYLYQVGQDEEAMKYGAFAPTIKATADSIGNISVFLEEPMSEMLQLHLSAKLNPLSDDYEFGFGFLVAM